MTNSTTPLRTLVGDGTWPFTAQVDGEDIVVGKNGTVYTTFFGGSFDSMDSGETASGYPTKGHPDLMGCALPMRVASLAALRGSPIPHMPFGIKASGAINPGGTIVRVYSPRTKKTIEVPCIDLGPGKQATTRHDQPHALDLSIAAYKALGLDLATGLEVVEYRILHAAHYVTL